MNNLSATVKSLRKQFNMTQEDLSLKSGVVIQQHVQGGCPTSSGRGVTQKRF